MLINRNVPQEKRQTATTAFIVPAFMTLGEIKDLDLKLMGFCNAFLKDVDNPSEDPWRIYMLFQPKKMYNFRQLEEKFALWNIEEYDYEGGYVVIVLRIPDGSPGGKGLDWRKDFELFKKGKYSEFSKDFQNFIPESYTDISGPCVVVRNWWCWEVINKSERLVREIEDLTGVSREEFIYNELCPPPDIVQETLDIECFIIEDELKTQKTKEQL